MTTFVIGDVDGCLDPLRGLLDQLAPELRSVHLSERPHPTPSRAGAVSVAAPQTRLVHRVMVADPYGAERVR